MSLKRQSQCQRLALRAPSVSPIFFHLVIVSLILCTFSTLSTASSIIHGIGSTKDNPTPQASTDHVPGVYFDRFYQIWLENIVICPQFSGT